MLDHDFLAIALTCQLAVWDIADLGDRTYLNLVSSSLCEIIPASNFWHCLQNRAIISRKNFIH
ncbi:hypothetical protein [Nostoc sp.]|uniref:hypothetical protein n=1 Tax=Nostoc sp. TaxID=1180 RepID=UPI002FF4EC09